MSEAKLEDLFLFVVLSEGQPSKTERQHRVSFHPTNVQQLRCVRSTHSWGKEGFRKGSESLPLTTLFFLCLASEVEATEREGDAGLGGFLLASSFLCRSISSLCWLMPSCCLRSHGRGHVGNSKTFSMKWDEQRLKETAVVYLIRFWNAYPSVHCSVYDAPCRTVVKWPRRRRSCMLFSRHDCFS